MLMTILGIDPGTASTGYGIITKKSKKLKCIDYNVIRTYPGSPPGNRLQKISTELTQVIKKYKPDILAIENIYFFRNLKTAIPVSQAKGVILLTAAKKKVPVREFTPLQIKAVVTGNGRANKKEVQKKIKKILKLKKIPKPHHASDALAVAVTCSIQKD